MPRDNTLLVVDNPDGVLTRKDVMTSIDNELVRLHDTGDINHATIILNRLDEVENTSGHAKSKLLWGMSQWHRDNRPDENFGDYIESKTTTKAVTAKRYVKVWEYIEDYTIPKEIAERPMRELIPISNTIAQGFEISKDDWRKIRLSQNSSELGDVLRKIKGKQPRKSARIIKLERSGNLVGYKGNQKYFIGYLNVKEAQNDIVLAEFIEKIKISSNIIED